MELLIAKVPDGIRLYIFENQTLSLAYNKIDSERFKWTGNDDEILFGRFFHDYSKMGALMISSEYKFDLFEIKNNLGKYEIIEFTHRNTAFSENCSRKTKALVVNLRKEPMETLVTVNENGLCVFEFDFRYEIHLITTILYSKTVKITTKDKLFFANLSGQDHWMDLIVLTSNGLFVFQYNDNEKNWYKLINYNPKFSIANKWNDKYSETIKFLDIDQNGFDDLIFTGPAGVEILSYDVFTNMWKSLLYTEDVSLDSRHATILHAFPPLEGVFRNPVLLTYHSGRLYQATVIEKPLATIVKPVINPEFPFKWDSTIKVPKIKTKNIESRQTMYLRDQDIWFEQLQSIDPQSGKPVLALPLVGNGKSRIKFHMNYDISSIETSYLGLGWSTASSFIVLNHQYGDFLEEENYVLIYDGIPYNLQQIDMNKERMEIETRNFESIINEGKINTNIHAKYFASKNVWHVNFGKRHQQFYGGFMESHLGATSTELIWRNWRGPGSDRKYLVERPCIWYLASSEIKGIGTYYKYETTRIVAPETKFSYNANILLEKIYNRFSNLTFSYANNRLSSYIYETKSIQQKVHFNYINTESGAYLLKSIEQESDYIAQPVIEFKYCEPIKGKKVINEIILPTGATIAYDYKLLGSPRPIDEENNFKISISDDYNVSYGPNYILVCFIRDGSVFLRMYADDLSKEIFPSKELVNDSGVMNWPILGENIKAFEILLEESFFAVIMYPGGPYKIVCQFGKGDDGNWVSSKCSNYNEDSIILKGKTFVIISDPLSTNIIVEEWFTSTCLWETSQIMISNEFRRSIAVHENKCVAYNDDTIFLIYKTNLKSKTWISKELISIPGFLKETFDIISKFDLNSDFKKTLLVLFRKNVIHLTYNVIVLNKLTFGNNKTFATKIETYIIGRMHEIVEVSSSIIDQDNIFELESEKETEYLDGIFTYKYVYENGKFKIVLANSYVSSLPRETLNDMITVEMNNPAKRFFLDLNNYFVSVHAQTIKCRNVTLTFGGKYWHRQEIQHSELLQPIMFGDNFTIKKFDHRSTLKLYKASNNEMVFDFGVTEIKELQIKYPNYIAFQKNYQTVSVLEFTNNGRDFFATTILQNSKKLSEFGNPTTLVTYNTDSKNYKILFITSIPIIRNFLPNIVVHTKKITINGITSGYKIRNSTYEYQENFPQLMLGTIFYNSLIISHGKYRKDHGYFNISANIVQYFDGDGQLVKTTERRKHEEAEENDRVFVSKEDDASILYSKDGNYEIAHFYPFSKDDEVCGFIGFEEYEKRNDWIFEKNNIIAGNFSFTGNNYLRLENSILKRKFQSKFQNFQFVASCWLRIPIENMPATGDIVPYLMIIILSSDGDEIMNFLADVKYQIDDWSYLEVEVDLGFFHLTFQLANQSMTNNLHLEVRVLPSKKISIDLDHVRISPIHKVFGVNVYDGENDYPIAIIQPNGAITRQLYDKYGIKIAEINESNQIKEFRTYTKDSYNSDPDKNPPCEIKITTERGFYESFSPNAFRNRWSLTELQNWEISHATLENESEGNILRLESRDIDLNSFGARFRYTLGIESIIKLFQRVFINNTKISKCNIWINRDWRTKKPVPVQGEVLFIKDENRIIVWVNGNLYIDGFYNNYELTIWTLGKVKIEHLILFNRPKVEVIYKNSLNEEIQRISLKSAWTATLSEFLYDELGRQTITLQTVEITRNGSQALLAYVADLVTNDDPESTFTIWKTRKLEGEISQIVGHEYAFTQIVYDNSPLNRKTIFGLPGKEFTANGIFALRLNTTTENRFLRNLYPPSQNFMYEVQIGSYPDGKEEKISIYDKNNLKIALYIYSEDDKDLFSTFDYNDQGLMTKCRTPMYYAIFGTFDKELHLVAIEESDKDHPLEINIAYDKSGNPIRKTTPDAGLQENIFDSENRLRFIIQYQRDKSNVTENISYFIYDSFNRITSTGSLSTTVQNHQLLTLDINEMISVPLQSFHYSDNERDPAIRNSLFRTVTMNHQEKLYEESIFNAEKNLISKRYIFRNEDNQDRILSINQQYKGSLLKRIIYPAFMFGEIFQVTYDYDKYGRMINVSFPGPFTQFVSFDYDASNRITNETFSLPNNNKYVRNYKYNEPGYLIEVSDPFLIEEISYTDKSYGRKRYGDGTITRVKHTARWHKFAYSDQIGVSKSSFQNDNITMMESQRCHNELEKEGYLSVYKNLQTRNFYPNLNIELSVACTNGKIERRVKEVLAKHGYPQEYGYRFDYWHKKELKIAKYFVGDITQEPEAFQSDSFARNIKEINSRNSRKIFDILKDGGYIEKDGNFFKFGKPFVRESLVDDLRAASPVFESFASFVEKLLLWHYIKRRNDIKLSFIENIFPPDFQNKTSYSEHINEILKQKEYLPCPIERNIINILKDFENFLPEIIEVIQNHLGRDRTEFDWDVKEVDLNGNLIHFSSGFNDYKLNYEVNSNRISSIVKVNNVNNESQTFHLSHDSRGNIIRATHKGIESMKYHPVSNRLEEVKMENGNVVNFYYDSKGERFLKRVIGSNGKTKTEIRYLRDGNGRTLVERKLNFIADNQEPEALVTTYIYGPISLIGFVRRNQFYRVLTDHQGSVRLIVRDGEVVAAYDYLPYGKLMRSFESIPDAQIPYLYTGQEWDSEIGLYNFHARFYDPTIGRFYSIDPVIQYFSPYKYAGNSPISMVDPCGSMAFLTMFLIGIAMIGFGLLGAYISGAAANEDLNIYNWDWSSRETQIAVTIGAVTGGMIPTGFCATTVVLMSMGIHLFESIAITTSVGMTSAYIMTAFQNNEMNSFNWNYSSPSTYAAAFSGFSVGVNIISGKYQPLARLDRSAKNVKRVLDSLKLNMQSMKKKESRTNVAFANDFPILPFHSMQRFYVKQINEPIHNNIVQKENFKIMIKREIQLNNVPEFFIDKIGFMFRDSYYDNLLEQLFRSVNYNSYNLTRFSEAKSSNKTFLYITQLFAKKMSNAILSAANENEPVDRIRDLNLVLAFKMTKLTFIFTRKQFTNLAFVRNFNGDASISNRPLNLKENLALIQALPNMILRMDEMLRNLTRIDLKAKNTSEWIGDADTFNKMFELNYTKSESIIRKLIESNNTSPVRDDIKSMLISMTSETMLSSSAKDRLLKVEEELQNNRKTLTSNRLNFLQINELKMRNKFLENSIKVWKAKEQFGKNKLVNIFLEKFKKFQMPLVQWQISNIAEFPILSSSSLPGNLTEDFAYLPFYKKEDVPDLAVFQKCYTCIRTVPKFRTEIEDIGWLMVLNESSFQKSFKAEAKNNRKRRFVSATDSLKSTQKEENEEKNMFKRWWQTSSKTTEIRQNNLLTLTPTNSKEQYQAKQKTLWNITEFGDKLLSRMPFNETLLLVEVLFAACCKRQLCQSTFMPPVNFDASQSLEFACKVIQLHEEAVKASATAAGIAENSLDMSHYHDLFAKILELVRKKRINDISKLMMEYAMITVSNHGRNKLGKLNRRKSKQFRKIFENFNLPTKIDLILIKLNKDSF